MAEIPENHPRYRSLLTRDLIAKGIEMGITSLQGLVAQGRGEAFDYLLGEKTTEGAFLATKAAVALMLLARHPVISVNGNVAALVPGEIVELSRELKAPIEVNLFHRTEERVQKIVRHLRGYGASAIYSGVDARIPNLSHERAKVDSRGIYRGDVVLVPLEDGDRCEALVAMGKSVIAIDLNPLSRTAQTATVTIVDNLIRVIPNMVGLTREMRLLSYNELRSMIEEYDNKATLALALEEIYDRLKALSR